MDVLLLALAALAVIALHSSRNVLYPHYAGLCGAGALEDQQRGAELMWVGGSMVIFIGFMVLAIEFARHESRIAWQEG